MPPRAKPVMGQIVAYTPWTTDVAPITVPAIVVEVDADGCVGLQVFRTTGDGTYYRRGVERGAGPGSWRPIPS